MSNTITLKIGQSCPATCYLTDGYVPSPGNNISWISSNPAVCVADDLSFVANTNNTVSTTTIHAISNGVCTVTALVNGNVSVVINVTVNSPVPAVLEVVLGVPSP